MTYSSSAAGASSDDNYAGEDNLAIRIRMERERRGWSAQQLIRAMAAEGCEVPLNSIGRIESGQRAIRFDEALALARVFEISLDDFATALPVLHDYKANESVVIAAERVERLFELSADATVALGAALSILSDYDNQAASTDRSVDRALEVLVGRIERRVRALGPDPTDPRSEVFVATVRHLRKLMEIAAGRQDDEGLLGAMLAATHLERFLPTSGRSAMSAEEQLLHALAGPAPGSQSPTADLDLDEVTAVVLGVNISATDQPPPGSGPDLAGPERG